MRIKTIKNKNLLNLFIRKTEEFLKISYPIEYLERSLVRGLFNDGELVGGYVICLEGPFRVIESLPEIDSMAMAERITNAEMSLCEFTGLWLDKRVKSNFANFLFWTQIYLDIIKSKKTHMVYAYGVEKVKLGQLYSIINPEVIYKGETKIMPGMKYAEKEVIEMASINYLKYAFFHRGDFLIKKLFLPRSLCNKKGNAMIPSFLRVTKRMFAKV